MQSPKKSKILETDGEASLFCLCKDLLRHILTFFDMPNLCSVCRTGRDFRDLCHAGFSRIASFNTTMSGNYSFNSKEATQVMAKYARSLKKLHWQNSTPRPSTHHENFGRFLQNNKGLRDLTLDFICEPRLADLDLFELCVHSVNLRSLTISYNGPLLNLNPILYNCGAQLTQLSVRLWGASLQSKITHDLSLCPKLAHLKSSLRLSTNSVSRIGVSNVQHLSLPAGLENVDDLSHFGNARSLNIECEEGTLQSIGKHIPQLECLYIFGECGDDELETLALGCLKLKALDIKRGLETSTHQLIQFFDLTHSLERFYLDNWTGARTAGFLTRLAGQNVRCESLRCFGFGTHAGELVVNMRMLSSVFPLLTKLCMPTSVRQDSLSLWRKEKAELAHVQFLRITTNNVDGMCGCLQDGLLPRLKVLQVYGFDEAVVVEVKKMFPELKATWFRLT